MCHLSNLYDLSGAFLHASALSSIKHCKERQRDMQKHVPLCSGVLLVQLIVTRILGSVPSQKEHVLLFSQYIFVRIY
jgi:hypothetical protein